MMKSRKAKKLVKWYRSLACIYSDFIKKPMLYRCKIVGLRTNHDTKETVFLVLIIGMKNQIVPYSPSELIINDDVLSEFSPFDVRAITFYALQQANSLSPATYSIVGQAFLTGKTMFTLRNLKEGCSIRKSAQQLYCDTKLLEWLTHTQYI